MRIAILIEDHYQELELWYPLLRFLEEGWDVSLVGPDNKKKVTSKYGYPAERTLSIKDASADDFDGVVVPGGYAPDLMRRDEAMLRFVRDMYKQAKLTAAICHGAWVLISAGIMSGKKGTCFFAIKDDLINAGAEYTDEEVIVDDNIITSRTPDDLPVFVKTCIQYVAETQQKAAI